jgi:hypothetical protein
LGSEDEHLSNFFSIVYVEIVLAGKITLSDFNTC